MEPRRLLLLVVVLVLAACRPGTARPRDAHRAAPARPPRCNLGAQAFAAHKVFEGRVRSRSAVRRGVYNVTFVVQRVWKGARHDFLDNQVRLRFQERPHRRGGHACGDDGDLVRVNISRVGAYIVFVDSAGDKFSYKPHGEPVRRNKKNVKEVENVLCSNCVKPPVLHPLGRKVDKRFLRLTCRVRRGVPLPTLKWFKDGKRILPNNRTKIISKKKRSVLTITSPRREDGGNYTCRAVSVVGESVISSTNVTVAGESRNDSEPCEREDLCLNDGKCSYIAAIGEWYCECADGFKGQRCENKDVSNQSSIASRSSSQVHNMAGKLEYD